MAAWHIGTMGFSYPSWRGVFYPPKMEAARFLTYYSRIFDSLEIDSTFYGAPSRSTVLGWKAAVPQDFTFSLKTPNAVTHQFSGLGGLPLFNQFISTVRYLEDKLGVILLQFPPSFQADKLPLLGEFLSRLPADLRFAVEVRHHSWYTRTLASPDLAQLLQLNNICWVSIEYPAAPNEIIRTSDFLYIRWIGKHGAFTWHDRERLERHANMQTWLKKIRKFEHEVEAVFGFFNDDYAGFAAGSAQRFKQLADLPAVDFTQPVQGQFF